MRRRKDDTRIPKLTEDVEHLHSCIEALKVEMKENTDVTKQVRDILTSFRILGVMAKWVAAIGAGTAALYHGIEWLKK